MNAVLPIPPRQRKPDWIRVKAPVSKGYAETRKLMRDLKLNTVCEEAACPNIGECWTKKHATVMILGDTCTRACAFCNVKTGMPRAVDRQEPEHVATAAAELGLQHIVVTSVDRDDLPDGGAHQFVFGVVRRSASMTLTNWLAPPSGRSSRSTDVTTMCSRPSTAAARAVFSGSNGSTARGIPVLTLQKAQARVHVSPRIITVACFLVQHSPMFGHAASSQTVARLSSRISFLVSA